MSKYQFTKDFAPTSFKNTELLKPIKVGSVQLQNRVAFAPLTRYRNIDYIPNTKLLSEYYGQRAQRPGTLLITEGTFISPKAAGFIYAPGIWKQEQVEAWKPIFNEIHEKGSFVFVQIWAVGRASRPQFLAEAGEKFKAPSVVYINEDSKKIALEANNPLQELTIPDIKEFIQDYAKAAKNSIEAGADGVELHAANGYLPNQFIDPISNKRTDEYGGSIENRARFTLEVIDALIEAVGADKVAIRLSPFGEYGGMSGYNKELIKAFEYIYTELEKRAENGNRIAYIHVVEARFPDNVVALKESDLAEDQNNENIYKFWKGVVIRAGDYASNPDSVKKDISNDRTLIAYGRYFISNPDLVDRLEEGLPLTKYNRESFYYQTAEGYTDYPNYKDQV